jgi:hypothetical protein
VSVPERRASPRMSFSLTVRVRSEGTPFPATLKSLSRVGALIEAAEPVPVGEALHLYLGPVLPGPSVELLGRVLRAMPSSGGHELALMFAPLPPELLDRLESLVAERGSEDGGV